MAAGRARRGGRPGGGRACVALGCGLRAHETSQPHRWEELANCRGIATDLFFPQRGESPEPARTVCHGCTVREECLDTALQRGERFGVWGGLTALERRSVLRRRRRTLIEIDGAALRRRRESTQLLIREVAALSGIPFRSVWALETGQAGPVPPARLAALARALRCSPAELTGNAKKAS